MVQAIGDKLKNATQKNVVVQKDFIGDLLKGSVSLILHPMTLRRDDKDMSFVKVKSAPHSDGMPKSMRKPATAVFKAGGFKHLIPCPWGDAGDVLRVMESAVKDPDTGKVTYWPESDDAPQPNDMPVSLTRIFLRVRNIGVKRLRDMTDEEFEKTGCGRVEFERRWTSRYGSAGTRAWTANPWVWCFDVEPCRA